MKTLKFVLLALLLSFFCMGSAAQNTLKNAVYLSPVSFNKPLSDFGFPKTEIETSLNTVGFGFGVGYLFYFTEPDIVNFGADVTFASLDFNFNNISLDGKEELTNSAMFAMKLGPVMTIVPQNQIGIDFYCQFMFAISGFDYYHEGAVEKVSAIPQYRVAPGMRFGYNVIYFNFEYNWGRPTVKKKAGTSQTIRELKVNQSFFKFGITIKFRAFE